MSCQHRRNATLSPRRIPGRCVAKCRRRFPAARLLGGRTFAWVLPWLLCWLMSALCPIAIRAQEQFQEQVFEPGMVVAVVGGEHVFRGELESEVNLIFGPALAKMPPEEVARQREQIERQKEILVRRFLENAVQRKLMYVAAMRQFQKKVPADKFKEAMGKMRKGVNEHFSEQLENMRNKVAAVGDPEELNNLLQVNPQMARLAILMHDNQAQREGELDLLLRNYGSSLRYQQQVFLETAIGVQSRNSQIDRDPYVSHAEMLDYYQGHADEFRVAARARWEQLTARFDKFPDKYQAGEHIQRMGNEALFGGSFIPVAKKYSQEINADEGGQHDWISQGSLKSKPLDYAIFHLPVGKMSDIFEDDQGLHIIRVIEREEAREIPFKDCQEEIKEKIRRAKVEKQARDYLEGLRKSTPVWTIYDEQPEQ